MAEMIKNPVLRGFHPDPCICRAGDDYYIATSTFQWFPGVELYHSRDLVHWEFTGRPLDEKRLLDMTGVPDSGGVWAPCLTYEDGMFYLVYSNVKTFRNYYKDVDNFLTCSRDIHGPWSDPVYLNSSGFDPSLFHDDDGKKYILNQIWDHRDKNDPFDGIALQEYDPEQQCMKGKPVQIFKGSSIGVTEGPHLYKINGMYYLVCAEGGTFYEHAVTVARSKNIEGPYELSPYHPLMTSYGHPELRLQKCGHGSLVCTQNGEWYMAHLCGRPEGVHKRCMLGRETSIQKLKMTEDGWFVIDHPSGLPQNEVPSPGLPDFIVSERPVKRVFPAKLPDEFQTLRIPLGQRWMAFNEERQSLVLYGKESMESLHTQSLVGIRREHFDFMAETSVRFWPVNYQQMAGMALYYDTTNYFYLNVSWDEVLGRTVSMIVCDHGEISVSGERCQIAEGEDNVYMRMKVKNKTAQFSWSPDGENYFEIGEELDATKLSDDYYNEAEHGLRFTGTFIVLCCQDTSGQRCPAEFEYLTYSPSGVEA
ncbi:MULTISPECIES: glycoside hydrolase family 43 protein [Clostridia]|jgi:xylan 1,4-beta-xylosidase|uniref:glycoside hydrolase family 43 protein n=1 Tax=Clostridia TaxID=186801 RepID=UPI001FAAA4B7|nr:MULTISPECIES: glycoside hydrolase family 43 protein [Clostridia]